MRCLILPRVPRVRAAPPLSPPCHTGTQGGMPLKPVGPICLPAASQWLRSLAVVPVAWVAPVAPGLAVPPVAPVEPVEPVAVAPPPEATLAGPAVAVTPVVPLSVGPAVASEPLTCPAVAPAVGPELAIWLPPAPGPLDGAMATSSTWMAATAMKGRYRRPSAAG